jgi:ferredoxin
MAIQKVWIEEGCTLCGVCTSTCPDVFEMGDESAQLVEDADLDAHEDCIREAADECPVEVIKFKE